MDDFERRQALADFLRTRRARISPSAVKLPLGRRRRTPGLRREEVAQLANIGTSWYIALEQARDVRPSEQVLESLAQALQLTQAERRHLFVLAQQRTTGSILTPEPEEEISAALRQAVEALDPHPAYVMGRRWDLLTWNRAAELVFAFSDIQPPHTRNFIWRSFTSPVLRKHANWEKPAQSLVAEFRADCARYPGDPGFAQLIEDLSRSSKEFRDWWPRHDVRSAPDGQKEMNHERFGRLEFAHVRLQVPDDSDQRLILYTCAPDTAVKIADLLR